MRSRPAGPRERAQRLADASPCEAPWGGRSQRPGWGSRAQAASAAGRRGGREARPRGQPLGRRARGLRVLRAEAGGHGPGAERGSGPPRRVPTSSRADRLPESRLRGASPQIPRAGAVVWPEDAGRPLAPAEASARTNFRAQSLLSSKSTCLSQKAGLLPARACLPLPSGSAAWAPPMPSAPLGSHHRARQRTGRWPASTNPVISSCEFVFRRLNSHAPVTAPDSVQGLCFLPRRIRNRNLQLHAPVSLSSVLTQIVWGRNKILPDSAETPASHSGDGALDAFRKLV